MLEQMITCFAERADTEDLDVLRFSLHHLFRRADFLYQIALPQVLLAGELPLKDILDRQRMWTSLRNIKRSFERIELLSLLLSNAIACILEAIDMTEGNIAVPLDTDMGEIGQSDEQNLLLLSNQEQGDQDLACLTKSLGDWQQSYGHLPTFEAKFAHLSQLDRALDVILDSVGAIFGDILPDFQALLRGDDATMSTLLFDLMQQSDLLTMHCAEVKEPLAALIEHFAVGVAVH